MAELALMQALHIAQRVQDGIPFCPRHLQLSQGFLRCREHLEDHRKMLTSSEASNNPCCHLAWIQTAEMWKDIPSPRAHHVAFCKHLRFCKFAFPCHWCKDIKESSMASTPDRWAE